MSQTDSQLLSDAIARNCALVLSLPSAGLLRHCKSRFLAESGEGIWIEMVADERALIEALIASGQPVGISFKAGEQKVAFATPATALDPKFRLNADTTISALQIAVPSQVKAVQRRENYRVHITKNSDVSVRLWRIAMRAHVNDRPQPSQQIPIELRDLSFGGMGVILRGVNGAAPKITTDDRLRIELTTPQTALILEGSMRSPSGPQPPDAICTGIRFKDLAGDLAGRHLLNQLTKIIGELQREEARRARLRPA